MDTTTRRQKGRVTDVFTQSRGAIQNKDVGSLPKQAQIKAASGITSRADHNEDEIENYLRQFDLNSKYGPLSGLTRLERYDRAVKLGLQPSEDIKKLIIDSGRNVNCFNQKM